MMQKPSYLNADQAGAFKARTVAEYYVHRPAYAGEVYQRLLTLIPETAQTVLDAGCGPGKIARGLVDHVAWVDAIDFSAEMIRVGRSLPQGDRPNLNWQCAALEEATLQPPYGLIVAGASLHWMDWTIVLPRFVDVLAPDGFLALVDGDGPATGPWLAGRKALIAEYSTNQDYRPFSTMNELARQGYLEPVGEVRTAPVTVKQTIADFLKSEHSRRSLAPDGMGPARMAEFDAEMRTLLQPYSVDGYLHYEVTTRIMWGKPAVPQAIA